MSFTIYKIFPKILGVVQREHDSFWFGPTESWIMERQHHFCRLGRSEWKFTSRIQSSYRASKPNFASWKIAGTSGSDGKFMRSFILPCNLTSTRNRSAALANKNSQCNFQKVLTVYKKTRKFRLEAKIYRMSWKVVQNSQPENSNGKLCSICLVLPGPCPAQIVKLVPNSVN